MNDRMCLDCGLVLWGAYVILTATCNNIMDSYLIRDNINQFLTNVGDMFPYVGVDSEATYINSTLNWLLLELFKSI